MIKILTISIFCARKQIGSWHSRNKNRYTYSQNFFYFIRRKKIKSLLVCNLTRIYGLQPLTKYSELLFMCFDQNMKNTESSDFFMWFRKNWGQPKFDYNFFTFLVGLKTWNNFWNVIRPHSLHYNHSKNQPNTRLYVFTFLARIL